MDDDAGPYAILTQALNGVWGASAWKLSAPVALSVYQRCVRDYGESRVRIEKDHHTVALEDVEVAAAGVASAA